MLYIAPCSDYRNDLVSEHINRILSERFSGCELNGKRVFIKVNGLTKANADQAMTTHPSLVEATAAWFISHGCTVGIGDNPAGEHEESWLHAVYRAAGYEAVAKKTGAKLCFDRELVEKPCEGENCTSFRFCGMSCDCDIFINIAKLKTHEYTRYTGCVKNMYGTLPASERSMLHAKFKDVNDFSNMLVDLYECVSPDLSILDAVVGMEGSGPSAGEPKKIGVIIASENGHDADFVGAKIIGMKVSEVKTLENASRRGLITVENNEDVISKIAQYAVKGFKMPVNSSNSLSNHLPKPLYRLLRNSMKNYPKFDLQNCISCGICAKNCPQGAITMKGKPSFDKEKCICCYCCQEMCPRKTIFIKDSFVSQCLVKAKKLYRKLR